MILYIRNVLIVFILFLPITFSLPLYGKDLTLKEAASIEERSEEVTDNFESLNNSKYVGETPLSTMLALQVDLQENNWKEAANYLDTRYLPSTIKQEQADELIRKLAIVWSQQNIVDLSTLSSSPKGHTNDNLPSYRDLLGFIDMPGEKIPVYLQRVPDEKHGHVWKISNSIISKIPLIWDEYGYHPLAESLSNYLPQFEIFHMQNWQFASLIILIICSWYLTAFTRWIMLKLISYSETYKDTMQRFFRVPLRMFLFFILLQWAVEFLGLSIRARIWLESGTLKYLALVYLTLGIIEFTFAAYISKNNIKKNTIAVLRPLLTTFKFIMVIVVLLNWLDDAGFNISTILTGFGIGSLAIALAAKNTLENIFGAFTLLIARPIQPGNFCKFGSVIGTVEEIGLRSTSIRKLNRSLVHIPNSILASSTLENYGDIDRRHYRKEIRLRLDTTPDQIRTLLIALRKLIYSHPETLDIAARVRFEDIERDAFLLKINAYLKTKSIIEFKAVEEDLNLRTLEIILAQGIQLAIPEQHLFVSKSKPYNSEFADQAKATVEQLNHEEKLPFPNFTKDELKAFKNTLPYPPKGASKV